MSLLLRHWLAIVIRRHREQVLVQQLLLFNDHRLADIGLRRDQLQPDGIRELDRPPPVAPEAPAMRRRFRPAIAPSLQGCG